MIENTTLTNNGLNITITAAIDNNSIVKLMLMFIVLIIIFFLFKRILG